MRGYLRIYSIFKHLYMHTVANAPDRRAPYTSRGGGRQSSTSSDLLRLPHSDSGIGME